MNREIRSILQRLADNARNNCGNCGGSGEVRVNVTGTHAIDFEKCKICNGHGEKQLFKNKKLTL